MDRSQWYIGAPNGIVACVNGRRDGELYGRFFHGYGEAPVPFASTAQLIHRMESFFDWLRFPFPGTNIRSFGEEKQLQRITKERKKIMTDDELLSRHGDIGTFIIRVQHRQNSSWQGRITWMEENRTMQFRSIWEMIKLMESAVDKVSDPESEEENWFAEGPEGDNKA